MLMRFFLRFDFIPLVSGEGWGSVREERFLCWPRLLVWARGVTGSSEPRGVCTDSEGSRLSQNHDPQSQNLFVALLEAFRL